MTNAPGHGERPRFPFLAAVLAGAGAVIFLNSLTKLGVGGDMRSFVPVAFVAFFLTGLIVGARISVYRGEWRIVTLFTAYSGIALGVTFWSLVVEELVFRRLGPPLYMGHNLFPIEVIFSCALGTVPLLVGISLPRWRRRKEELEE